MGKRAAGKKAPVIDVDKEAKRPKRKKTPNPKEETENANEKEKKKEDPPLKFAAVTRDSFNALFGKPAVPLPSLEAEAVSAPVATAPVSDSLEAVCTAETQVAPDEELSTPPPVFAKPVEADLNCPDSLGTSKGQPSSKSELFTEFTLNKICERLSRSNSEKERSKMLDGILTQEIDEDSFPVLLKECLAHPALQAHVDKVMSVEGIPPDEWKFGDEEGDPQEDVSAFIQWLVQENRFVLEPRSLEDSFQNAGDSAVHKENCLLYCASPR